MTNKCGSCRLAVGAGDCDVAQRRHRAERDLHFTDNWHAIRARGNERCCGWRHAGTDDDQRRPRDSRQIVRAGFGIHTERAESRRRLSNRWRRTSVGRVDSIIIATKQRRYSDARPTEAQHCDLARRPADTRKQRLAHRSLSVPSARNAQRIPMIQNRITTCVSGQPFNSKW